MLNRYQEIFWNLISYPEGVKEGLQHHRDIKIEEWFLGDEVLSSERRLDIYANMYFWRIHDAILEDYPAVAKVVGKEHWNNIMTEYLLRYPSETPFLQYAGRHLPAFLKESSYMEAWPFLYDLAVLEWERALLFEAPDANCLSMQDLQKIPAEDWPQLKFSLIPAFKILDLRWDVDQAWRQTTEAQAITRPLQKETVIKIWRKDYVVCHNKISRDENRALHGLGLGSSFANICEQIGSAEAAAALLSEWVSSGMIAKGI